MAVRRQEFEVAARQFSELVDCDPGNVDFQFGYAQALFGNGQIEASLHRLDEARGLAPEYEDVWILQYRALTHLGERGDAGAALDEFRREAGARFPDSDWYQPGPSPSGMRWEISATRDYLDNGAPEWTEFAIAVSGPVGRRSEISASAISSRRFDTSDSLYGVGARVRLNADWSANALAAFSDAPDFLPKQSIEAGLTRRFDGGWVAGVLLRHRAYTEATVGGGALTADYYFGKYRIGYSWQASKLDAELGIVQIVSAGYYAASGTQLGLTLATGDEIESVSPGNVGRTPVRSIGFNGRIPAAHGLSFGWQLGVHEQGSLYRRYFLGVSVSGGF